MTIQSLVLYSYFYTNGVIDLPPSLANLVRSDDGPVKLLLGDEGNGIAGQVIRNFSRHYQKRLPQILGGAQLREWFQTEYLVNNYIDINFISFETIRFPRNPLSKELRQKDVPGLIEMFLGYTLKRDWLDDTTVMPALRREIVRRGEPAVNPLIRLLIHPDWAVRDDATLMLGYLQNPQAVDPLLTVMMKDESQAVQERATDALVRIGTPRALALVRIYQEIKKKFTKS